MKFVHDIPFIVNCSETTDRALRIIHDARAGAMPGNCSDRGLIAYLHTEFTRRNQRLRSDDFANLRGASANA
jgi:hypothetical protein